MNARARIVVSVFAMWLAGCSQTHSLLEAPPAPLQNSPLEPGEVDRRAEADAQVDETPVVVDEQPNDADDDEPPMTSPPSEQPHDAIDDDEPPRPVHRIPEDLSDGCQDGPYEPLVARPGEICYEFRTHNGNGIDPYEVQLDESYNQLYYEIPWGEDAVATSFGGDYDNVGVLQRWLLFASRQGTPGTVDRNVTGTTLFTDAELLAGWAQGGCNVTFPADFGLELPGPSTGKTLMIQWHHVNLTGTSQPDATVVQVCTVPRSERAHIGSVTWLGTESLTLAPGVESTFTSTCVNDSAEPITLVALWPYMHQLGTAMALDAIGVDGSTRPIFDRPHWFDYNSHYFVDASLRPGEQVRTTCTYFNSTPNTVGFGQSFTQEMCFMFAFSYPAHALDNGVVSLFGATNTCW